MQIYINRNEIQAVRNAWEQINCNLEACTDEKSIKEMKEILKDLESIEQKYIKIFQTKQ